jgi:peroxiredoxin
VVLAVNLGEPADRVRDYVLKHKLTFPVLLDSDSSVARSYGVRGTPTRFLIDRQGRMIAGSIGPQDWMSEEAQKLITRLVGAGT